MLHSTTRSTSSTTVRTTDPNPKERSRQHDADLAWRQEMAFEARRKAMRERNLAAGLEDGDILYL